MRVFQTDRQLHKLTVYKIEEENGTYWLQSEKYPLFNGGYTWEQLQGLLEDLKNGVFNNKYFTYEVL